MFVYTLSRKRAFRMALIILAVFVGIAIGIASILTAVNTGAVEGKLPVYSVERGDNKISLTFDCAWGNSNTDALLEILAKEEVKVTFFVTGEFCDKYPDDIRKFVNAGHEIANHSDKHPHIKGMNINDFIQDVKECNRKIKMITGTTPTLYRAPYGEYDDNVISTINGMSMSFIQWSVDSIDWQEPDAATISKRILDNTVSGSILLFHNDLANTTEALPNVITKLKQQGFEFAKVSDLIYTKDFKIDNTGKQIPIINTIISTPVSSNQKMDEILSILSNNLTYEEISSLENGITPQIATRLALVLSPAQIETISELSVSEYNEILSSLMTINVDDYETYEDEINNYDDNVYFDNNEIEEEIDYENEQIISIEEDGSIDERIEPYGSEYDMDEILEREYYNSLVKGGEEEIIPQETESVEEIK